MSLTNRLGIKADNFTGINGGGGVIPEFGYRRIETPSRIDMGFSKSRQGG
jgi:hypothetical protein